MRDVTIGNTIHFVVTTQALEDAIRHEWRDFGKLALPRLWQQAPLSVLAYRSHYETKKNRTQVIKKISESLCFELICYREARNTVLGDKQHRLWQPCLDWFQQHYAIHLQVNLHGDACLLQAVASTSAVATMTGYLNQFYDDFFLTALYDMTMMSKSLVLSLCCIEQSIDQDAFYRNISVEEQHQLDVWGRKKRLKNVTPSSNSNW